LSPAPSTRSPLLGFGDANPRGEQIAQPDHPDERSIASLDDRQGRGALKKTV
jgi:hypothetical protein